VASGKGDMEIDMEEVVDNDNDNEFTVVSNYQPRLFSSTSSSSGKQAEQMMVDPISGKAIPADQMEEHMRVQLLDPKWRLEQQRFAEKQKETAFAEGGSIADSLKSFAKKRGDIFGQSAVQATAIAAEQAIEKRKSEVFKYQLNNYYIECYFSQ
jgi:splicing factor 3A subunit 1